MWLALSQIKSSDVGRRVKAIEELSEISDLKAMLALIGALADSVPRVRIAAAQAIAVQRDERCVQPLLAALRDPHAGVREAIIEALKAIGHKSAIPYLAPLLCDGAPNVRAHAAHALRALGWKAENDEQEALFCIAAGRFAKAAEFGGVAVAPLIRLLADESGSVRRASIEALAEIHDPRGQAAIAGRLSDPDTGVCLVALNALGRSRDASFAPGVRPFLTHADKNLRGAALEALIKMSVPDLFQILVKALKDEHWNIRSVAAAAMGAQGDRRAITPLAAALRVDDDNDVRQVMVEALGRMRDPNAIEPLILAQLDTNRTVRQAAATALFQTDREWAKSDAAQRALPAVKRALKHEDYGVRQIAGDLLNRHFNIRQCQPALLADGDAESVRRERAVDVLASMLWDEDTLIRLACVRALQQIGEPRAAGPVATRLQDPEPMVRRAAERALSDFTFKEQERARAGHAVNHSEDWGTGPVA